VKDAIYFMAVLGMAYSLTLLGIGAPYRWVGEKLDWLLFRNQKGSYLKVLVHCPACTGFWVALGFTFWHSPLGPLWIGRFMTGLACTGGLWIVQVILTKLGQYEE
jgi:hypothetical protein